MMDHYFMKRIARNGLLLVAALALLVAFSSGCGGSKGRSVDVSSGEYYSEAEYTELSNKEKEAYCAALEGELSQLQGDVDTRQAELQATRQQIESLRNQIAPVERELLRIESDIRALSGQVATYEAMPREWRIQSGECLWIIAGHEEIYADPIKWPRVFRANTDKIDDPEWIYPDTVLVIPRDWPRAHRVALDESLSLIASYWEVYGNPMDWTHLFEANKDAIRDPDIIIPEQLLSIPRPE